MTPSKANSGSGPGKPVELAEDQDLNEEIFRRCVDQLLWVATPESTCRFLAAEDGKFAEDMGREYGVEFNSLFPALARKHNAVFYRFFLDGVAGEPRLNQQDGIHPNRAGVDEIVQRILPKVMATLKRVRQ